MDSTVVALAASLVSFAAFATAGALFLRGKWLALLAGRAAHEPADADALRTLGRRMAVVLGIGCALMLTLAAFLGAQLARSAGIASAAALANNVAFIAFIVALIWFFLVQRPPHEREEGDGASSPIAARARSARLNHVHTATILFAIALIAVVALVGMLAAL